MMLVSLLFFFSPKFYLYKQKKIILKWQILRIRDKFKNKYSCQLDSNMPNTVQGSPIQKKYKIWVLFFSQASLPYSFQRKLKIKKKKMSTECQFPILAALILP